MHNTTTRAALLASAAALCLLAGAGPASADPIFTPILVAGFTAAGISTAAGTAGAFAVSVISGVLTAAIGIGLSLLLAPKPPRPENGSIAVQQAIAPRTYGYGTFRAAGAVVFLETDGDALNQVSAVLGHRIDSVVQHWLNDDEVTVDTNGRVQQLSDGRYNTGIGILFKTRLGLPTETAYSDIVNAYPAYWTTSHRGDGIASLMLKCGSGGAKDFQKNYPYGQPKPSITMNAYRVFDPRDPAQSPADETTWSFAASHGQLQPPGRNCALAILHFLCFSEYGPKRDYATTILPVLDRWKEEADICDELVALKAGGTEPRYALGGFTTTEQDDRSSIKTMLACCDGWLCERGDQTIVLTVGKYREPTVWLTDADIVGFFLQTGLAAEDSANQIKATYTSPDAGYSTVDTDLVELIADQLARGQVNQATVELTWVQSTGQASRLLTRHVIRLQEARRGRLDLRLSGLNACYERWIGVRSNTIPGMAEAVVENNRPTISLMGGGCTVQFVGSGPGIEAYDPSTQESSPPVIPQRPAAVGPPIPSNVLVVPEKRGDGTIYLAVLLDSPTDASGVGFKTYDYSVQWSPSGQGAWTEQRFDGVVPGSSRLRLGTNNVPGGATLDVRVASIATKGTYSQFSPVDTVSTASANVAPGQPYNLTAVGSSGHAALGVTTADSTNIASVRFYRSAKGSPFASGTPVGAAVAAAASQTVTATDTVGAGQYDFWAVSISAAGVASSPVGPTTATVT